MSGERIEGLIRELSGIPWFERLGRPSARDEAVVRIFSWDEWQGPETPGATLYAALSQQWHDDIFDGAGDDERVELMAIEKRLHAAAFPIISDKLPWDPDEDPWHGPTNAVDSACWLVAVAGLAIAKHGTLPSSATFAAAWQWYRDGHWPFAFDWHKHMRLSQALAQGLLTSRLVVF